MTDFFENMFGKANPPAGKKYDFVSVEVFNPRPGVVVISWGAAGIGFGDLAIKDEDGVITVDSEHMSDLFVQELIEYVLAKHGDQHRDLFERALADGRKDHDYIGIVRPSDVEHLGWKLKKDVRIFPRKLNPLVMAIQGSFLDWEVDPKDWANSFITEVSKTLKAAKTDTDLRAELTMFEWEE